MTPCRTLILLSTFNLLACAAPGFADDTAAQCQAGNLSSCEETSLLQTRVMQGRDTDDLKSLCGVLKSACKCTDGQNQEASLDCDVKLWDNGPTVGVGLDINPCGNPATVSGSVNVLGKTIQIAKADPGHPVHIPIPGVSINIKIFNVGINLDVVLETQDSGKKLSIDVGFNGCVKLPYVPKTVCGSDIPGLKNVLPVIVFKQTIDISEFCGQSLLLSQSSQFVGANTTEAVNMTKG